MKAIKFWDIIAWSNWLFYFVLRLPAKLLAPLIVPLLSNDSRKSHSVFGVDDATDLSYWNIAIRNGAHNFGQKDWVPYETLSNSDDHTLEKKAGLQWRLRRSKSGAYISFRVTWGEPRASKGKREFYIGWTINESPKMRPTLQFRPW